MNRRKFLTNLLGAFTILPSAGRVWKAERKLLNPAYVDATHEYIFISPTFHHIPTLQDYIRFSMEQHPLRFDFDPLLETTHKWPPNMGEVTRTGETQPIVCRAHFIKP